MKKIVRLFFAFSFFLPALNLHAQPFEGTLYWTMAMPSIQKFDVIINYKGDKSEIEMNMGSLGSSKMWSDRATKKNYMMLSTLKNGTVQDMGDITPNTSASTDIKPTGKKETIAGYAAEEYLNKVPTGEVSIWMTPDLPKDVQYSFYNWMANSPGQDPNQIKMLKEFTDKGLVPVRIVALNDGKVGMTMEFVKFERKSLPDALFVPPTDVKFESAATK